MIPKNQKGLSGIIMAAPVDAPIARLLRLIAIGGAPLSSDVR